MGLFEWTPLALHMDLHGISICASECSFCMERPSVVRDLRGVVLWPFKIYDPWACSIFESPQKNRCFLVMSMFHRKNPKGSKYPKFGMLQTSPRFTRSILFLAGLNTSQASHVAELMSNFWAHVQTQTYRIIYIDLLRFIWYSLRVYPARLRRLSQFRPFKLPIVYPHSTSIFHLVVHLPSYQHPPDPHHEISHQIPPVFVAQRPAKASQSACNGYCAGHTVSGWLAKFRAQHLVFRTTLGGPCSVVLMVWYQL
jgi:hypothetical protein